MLMLKCNKTEAKKYSPMLSYFESIINGNNFLKEVNSLTSGNGGAIEGVSACTFPEELDEYELAIGEGFDGIEFILFEDKISVDVPTFRKYLRMACEVYWTEYPESKAQLENYLARPQPPLEKDTLDEWKRRKADGQYPKPYSEFENGGI